MFRVIMMWGLMSSDVGLKVNIYWARFSESARVRSYIISLGFASRNGDGTDRKKSEVNREYTVHVTVSNADCLHEWELKHL